MKLVPVNEIPAPRKLKITGQTRKLLVDFILSGNASSRIEESPHKDAASCASCFREIARKMNLPVRVRIRGEQVYLERKDIVKE